MRRTLVVFCGAALIALGLAGSARANHSTPTRNCTVSPGSVSAGGTVSVFGDTLQSEQAAIFLNGSQIGPAFLTQAGPLGFIGHFSETRQINVPPGVLGPGNIVTVVGASSGTTTCSPALTITAAATPTPVPATATPTPTATPDDDDDDDLEDIVRALLLRDRLRDRDLDRDLDGDGVGQQQQQQQQGGVPVALPVAHGVGSSSGSGPKLPKTGVDLAEVGGLGTVSLLAGFSLVEFARRRRRNWLAPVTAAEARAIPAVSPTDVAPTTVAPTAVAPTTEPLLPTGTEVDLLMPYAEEAPVIAESAPDRIDPIIPTF